MSLRAREGGTLGNRSSLGMSQGNLRHVPTVLGALPKGGSLVQSQGRSKSADRRIPRSHQAGRRRAILPAARAHRPPPAQRRRAYRAGGSLLSNLKESAFGWNARTHFGPCELSDQCINSVISKLAAGGGSWCHESKWLSGGEEPARPTRRG